MNSHTSRHLILFVLTLLLTGSLDALYGQDLDNATISGRILDQHGAAIPNARVVAIIDTGQIRSTVSDPQGRYHLIQLTPGKFSVQASADGFEPREKKDITLVAAQSIQFDFILLPKAARAEVVVITPTDIAAVDVTRVIVGGNINRNELDSLPIVSRSPLDLVLTFPGVSEEPLSTRELAEDRNTNPASTPQEAGNFSLAGAPAYSNNITIDGMDNNDDRAARERFQPPLDAVEEVQIVTNQFSAEYGRASGGRLNLRTRSGSKIFSGGIFYYFRDEALNANTFGNNSRGLPRLPLQEHDLGFTLGGPVKLSERQSSAQTFFFTAYENLKVLDSTLIDTLLPVEHNPRFALPRPTSLIKRRLENVEAPATAAEIAPFVSSVNTPLKNKTLTTKVDHNFNELHNGSFLYQRGQLANLRQFGGGNRLFEALQERVRNSDALSYSDNFVFSSMLVNQARIQFSRLAPSLQATAGNKPVVLINIDDSLAVDDSARRSGTIVAGTSTSGATTRSERRMQLQEILASTIQAHTPKLGFDLQYIRSTFTDLTDATGTFNFASAGDFLRNVPTRFRQNFQTSSTQRNTYVGFFLQEDWRLRSNLTVSYGFRYERETIIRDLNNVSPRFSVAYDPFNSGNTVLRFGFGTFYNRVLLRTIDDFTVGHEELIFDTNALSDPQTGKLLSPDQRRAFIATHLQFPDTLGAGSALVQEFGIRDNNFLRRLDPKLRIPESYQTNLGAERYLGHGLKLEVNYSVTRGAHLWREFNANAPVLPSNYSDFSEYLASRDFPNFRHGPGGLRPLYNGVSAGELVRFVLSAPNTASPNSVGRVIEFGVPVSLVNLNSVSSTTSVDVALAALNHLRPDPQRAEIEELISAGKSFYRGLTFQLRHQVGQNERRFSTSFRAAYTFSHLIDDGVVNTSDALRPRDFNAEMARSLTDRRHRFVFSGSFNLPSYLGQLQLAPICRITSGAPFNISLGGADRNLDDVGNDRPIYYGDIRLLRWHRPGTSVDASIADLFALPAIGQSGNLPRNAGQGPGQFFLDLNITRHVKVSDRVRLRASIEVDNVLNKTVFSFGSEFINFSALLPTVSPQQRQAFLDSFLVATRTLRPRQIRLGLRLEF